MSGSNTPKYRAFKTEIDTLATVCKDSLTRVAVILFGKNLTTKGLLEEAGNATLPTYDRSSHLMTYVLSKIEEDEANYDVFISELSKVSELDTVIKRLEKALKKYEHLREDGEACTQLTQEVAGNEGTRLAGGELKKDKRKEDQLTSQQGTELQEKTREQEGLALRADNLTKDEHIQRLQTEKQQLQQELATQDKLNRHQQVTIGTLESQVQELRLRETQQREELQSKDAEISRLREEGRKHPQPQEGTGQVGEDNVFDHQNPSGPVKLTWRRGEPAPEYMTSDYGSAVAHGNTAYFTQNYNVYSYTVPENKWTKLPPCKYQCFALAVINNIVTSIGGEHDGTLKATNILLGLIGSMWKDIYTPMPTKRKLPAAASTPTYLVVAGGSISEVDNLATVEVLNTDTLQWSTARRLPESAAYPQLTLCGGSFYLAVRCSKIFSCSEELLKPTSANSSDCDSVWTRLAEIPIHFHSTLATLRGRVLAIGGFGQHTDAALIHSYDVATKSWNDIGEMPTLLPSSRALAAVLPSNELVVVHGKYTEIVS